MSPSTRSFVRVSQPPQEATTLITRIANALKESGYGELENIRIHPYGENVLLTGSVSAFYLRQKAECIALGITGAGKLDSRIRVMDGRALLR